MFGSTEVAVMSEIFLICGDTSGCYTAMTGSFLEGKHVAT